MKKMKTNKIKRPFFWLLFFGFWLRVVFIFLDYSFDVNNHIIWAKDLTEKGFAGFFDRPSSEVYASLYPNYPPLALFLFYLFYPLPQILFKIVWWLNVTFPPFPSSMVYFLENRLFLAAMLKLPAIITDLGLAWLIYLFVKKLTPQKKPWPLLVLAAILFNPAFFYNSAYWGQIDVIPLFFVLGAFYFLLFTKRYLISGLLFTAGFLIKPTILVFVPVYVGFFLIRFKLTAMLKTTLLAAAVFWLAFVPFMKKSNVFLYPFVVYFNKIIQAQSLAFVTNGAFNFWALIIGFEGIKPSETFIFGLSYRVVAYLITSVLIVVIIYRSSQLKNQGYALIQAAFLTSWAAFLFLPQMHERYFMLPLPFLLLMAAQKKSCFKWFIILSGLSFLNLYHSWPVPRLEFLVGALANPLVYKTISLINVMLFFYFLVKTAKNQDQRFYRQE